MNKLLKQQAEEIIKQNKKDFSDLKDLDIVIINLCDKLSYFGFYDEDNVIIKGDLFDIFMYLYNYNNEKLEEIFKSKKLKGNLTNKNKEEDLYKHTLRVINGLTCCITKLDYLYEDIITVCNGMTQKLYNISYEEFLIDCINRKKEEK